MRWVAEIALIVGAAAALSVAYRSFVIDRERTRIMREVLRCHLACARSSADLADALVRIVYGRDPPVVPFVPSIPEPDKGGRRAN